MSSIKDRRVGRVSEGERGGVEGRSENCPFFEFQNTIMINGMSNPMHRAHTTIAYVTACVCSNLFELLVKLR